MRSLRERIGLESRSDRRIGPWGIPLLKMGIVSNETK